MAVSLAKQLAAEIGDSHASFANRLCAVEYEWKDQGLQVSGNYFHLSLHPSGKPNLQAFVDYLDSVLIQFCIPRVRHRRSARKAAKSDYGPIAQDREEAKSLFIQATKQQSKSGEPGELILFALLEAVLSAPQIACKMYLKTSTDMPIHGIDAVHALPGSLGENLKLVCVEAKLHASRSSAISKFIESTLSFVSEGDQKKREISIIKSGLNIEKSKLRESLLGYFDPYSDKLNDYEESHACFIGYDEPALSIKGTREEVEPLLHARLEGVIEEACRSMAEKWRAAGLEEQQLHLFLVPFPAVLELRKLFFKRLGVALPEMESGTS